MIHSILHVGNDPSHPAPIPQNIFDDMNMRELFCDEATDVLRQPCDRDTIYARQEVFALLCDDEYYAWFERFHQKIGDFCKIRATLFSQSISEIASLVIFYSYIQSYLAFSEASANTYHSFFMERMNENANGMRREMDDVKDEISQYKSCVEEISSLSMTFDSGSFSLKKGYEKKDGLSRDIYRYCDEIGYRKSKVQSAEMKIDTALSDGMMKLYPEATAHMKKLWDVIFPRIDRDIERLKAESEFYIFINQLRIKATDAAIPYCFPEISPVPEYSATALYDISLMKKAGAPIIPNDIALSPGDSVYFIRGANGGGKTTFLRAVAINLILFVSGCPVFCKAASIYPFRKMFSHFRENEGFSDGGRLLNEERRLYDVSHNSDDGTFVFLNETYTGADEKKGVALSVQLMRDLIKSEAFCLFVTHFHQTGESEIPAFLTVVDRTDENRRTYRIVKSEKAASSFANDILRKHGLDAASLQERFK